MSTIIDGTAGITFPDASTQSKAVSQVTPFAVTASAIAGAELQLPEATANGVNYVAIKAPNTLAANTTFTLPAADGTNGQVLQTNGTGALAFGNVSPAGTTGQVQINSAGAFGALASGTAGQVLISNGSGSAPAFATPRVKVWSSFSSTGSYTVPSGVTSIRIYAFGGGGDGAVGSGAAAGGGGGGGCAFGDYAVTPGQRIKITISAKTVTGADGATTLATANPGQNATGSAAGAGGTASIAGSITGGGANSGATGGANNGGGGGSSGSPLGVGFAGGTTGGGGGGWGGVGAVSQSIAGGGGGGTGGPGSNTGGGGGSGGGAVSQRGGIGREPYLAFTDPLLAPCNGRGGDYIEAVAAMPGGSVGGGGAGGSNVPASASGGTGGFGGGGGGAWSSSTGGLGGFGSGGGGNNSSAVNGKIAGNGGIGGGGGGCNASPGTAGTGGAAICLIYA